MRHHSHFGVYAVVQKNQKMLVIKKARGPYTGLYDLPGGSPEEGELLEETVSREVLEETGLQLQNAHQLGALSACYGYIDSGEKVTLRHISFLFEGEARGVLLTTGDGVDSDGALWVLKKNLSEENTTPFLLAAVKGFTLVG